MTSKVIGLVAWIGGLGLACAPDGDDLGDPMADSEGGGDDEGACVPGQSVGCTCFDGSKGAQVCEADGSGLGACSCDGSPGSGDGGSGPAADGDGGGDGDGGSTIVSFADDVVPIFERTCGASTMGCHDAEPFNATVEAQCRGWLSLANEPLGSVFNAGEKLGQSTGCPDFSLHERLLDIGSWSCSPGPGNPDAGGGVIKRYVVPGDPTSSYLLQRANLQVGPCDLPDDPDPMPPVGSIDDADLATIEQWILQGALNN